jgi:hypothetical protein
MTVRCAHCERVALRQPDRHAGPASGSAIARRLRFFDRSMARISTSMTVFGAHREARFAGRD